MEINNLTSSFPLPENLNTLKFASNFQYRNYLTQNGNNILNIDNNNFILKQKDNCNYYQTKTPVNNQQPFIYNLNNIREKPYGYTESNLKNNYISKRIKEYRENNFIVVNTSEYIHNIPHNFQYSNVKNQ